MSTKRKAVVKDEILPANSIDFTSAFNPKWNRKRIRKGIPSPHRENGSGSFRNITRTYKRALEFELELRLNGYTGEIPTGSDEEFDKMRDNRHDPITGTKQEQTIKWLLAGLVELKHDIKFYHEDAISSLIFWKGHESFKEEDEEDEEGGGGRRRRKRQREMIIFN
jgi:hypothetical protein